MNARMANAYRLRLHSGYFSGFVLPIVISPMAARIIVANLSASPRPQARLRRAVTAAADMSTLISFLMSDSILGGKGGTPYFLSKLPGHTNPVGMKCYRYTSAYTYGSV